MRQTPSAVLDKQLPQRSASFKALLLAEEKDCDCFKFWQDGATQNGLRYKDKLFAHYRRFQRRQHQQVHQLALQLAQHSVGAIVTCSRDHYDLWIDLRSHWWRIGQDGQRQIIGFLPGIVP